jgi:hypothetical protein
MMMVAIPKSKVFMIHTHKNVTNPQALSGLMVHVGTYYMALFSASKLSDIFFFFDKSKGNFIKKRSRPKST